MSKLFEYNYAGGAEEVGTLPIEDLLKQHNKRVKFETSAGSVILKYITWSDHVRISRFLGQMFPEFLKITEEITALSPLIQTGKPSKKNLQRSYELAKDAESYVPFYSLCCFVSPPLTKPAQLDAIFSAIKPHERIILQELLRELTKIVALDEVDTRMLTLAKINGVQIIDPAIFQGNGTVSQIAVITAMNEKELEAMKKNVPK